MFRINMKILASTAIFAFTLTGCCFGSGAEQQERGYKYKLENLDELIARAEGDLKDEIEKEKAQFIEAYKALPPPDQKKKRGEEIGKLHQDMRPKIAAFEAKIEKAEQDMKYKLIRQHAGRWVGGGVDLTIAYTGQVEYKRVTGSSSKSLNGSISRFTKTEFDVKILGISTTFKIDEPPHQEGEDLKMTVDGAELTRVEGP